MRFDKPGYGVNTTNRDQDRRQLTPFEQAMEDVAAAARSRQGRSSRAPAVGINPDPFRDGTAPNHYLGGVNREDIDPSFLGTQAFTRFPEMDVSYKTETGGAAPDQLRQQIIETAKALGISPVDLGTAISYETGGTFDPLKYGPTTQWGHHRGLIQFGEPQAKKYGVDWNDPLGSQLGANGAVAKYLRDTGVKPGMGMMDIYSAINAGGVGPDYYGRSDANNGGAPGTVADKVNNQMAAHREKAAQLLGGSFGAADGPKGQESYAPPVFGSMAPGMMAQDNSIDPNVAAYAFSDDKKKGGLEEAGKHFSDAMSAIKPPRIAPMPSPSGDVANGLSKFLQNPQALAQLLMKQRLG